MTTNSQFHTNTSASAVSDRGNRNGSVLPIRTPSNCNIRLGDLKSPPTPTTQSKPAEYSTATVSDVTINEFFSSIGFLPPTPRHTPKAESSAASPPAPAPTSPSAPILLRDRYDLNYDRTPSNDYLNNHSESIRTHYQTLEFYRKWTSHFISQLSGIPITRNTKTTPPANFGATTTSHVTNRNATDLHSFPPRADYPNELAIINRQKTLLKEWEIDVAKAEMNALADLLINRPLPEDDTLLYRAHTPESKSPYSRAMGIRCSDWESSLINDMPTKKQISGQAFRDHCNKTEDPSPYISVHKSVARMVRFITECDMESPLTRVFVISLHRLKQLGIKARCTDDILDGFIEYRKNGGSKKYIYPNGVSYVTDSHWLVEGWIPDQAILSEMPCSEFLGTAESEGIGAKAIEYIGKGWYKKLGMQNIDLRKWPDRKVEEKKKLVVDEKSRFTSVLANRAETGNIDQTTSSSASTPSSNLDAELSRLTDAIGNLEV